MSRESVISVSEGVPANVRVSKGWQTAAFLMFGPCQKNSPEGMSILTPADEVPAGSTVTAASIAAKAAIMIFTGLMDMVVI